MQRTTLRILCALGASLFVLNASAQIVYDSITGSNYHLYAPDSDEEADKVGLASIEHPITRIRIWMYALNANTTLTLNIYGVDAKTGLPGEQLATSSVPFVGSTKYVDVPFSPLQLTSNDIWVGYRCVPYSSFVGPQIGFGPSVGRSERYIAYKDQTGWHFWQFLNADGNIAMQIFMTPEK